MRLGRASSSGAVELVKYALHFSELGQRMFVAVDKIVVKVYIGCVRVPVRFGYVVDRIPFVLL